VTEEFAKHAKQLAEEILGLLSEGLARFTTWDVEVSIRGR
jgi:hypothetical protein